MGRIYIVLISFLCIGLVLLFSFIEIPKGNDAVLIVVFSLVSTQVTGYFSSRSRIRDLEKKIEDLETELEIKKSKYSVIEKSFMKLMTRGFDEE